LAGRSLLIDPAVKLAGILAGRLDAEIILGILGVALRVRDPEAANRPKFVCIA
jgi:hypothetical protein